MKKKKRVSVDVKLKGFVQGFKDFIMKGNVIDMAVGVIIGGAFGKIITSLVNDIILPPIGVLLNGVDFKDLHVILYNDVTLNYGNFIQVIIEFLIIAFTIYLALFFIIKRRQYEEELAQIEAAKVQETQKIEAQLKHDEERQDAQEEIELLKEIRDLLGELKK